MPNENGTEVIAIDDEDVAAVGDLPTAKEGETIDWEAEAKKFKGIADRKTTKLSKLKSAKPVTTEKKPDAPQATKPGELDYGQKAFLVANGYKAPEQMEFVQKTMKDSGLSLEGVLGSPYGQAELKRIGEELATKAATPPADDRNGAPARDKVEYWVAKGEMPPNDGTPASKKLREQYVNARASRENSGNPFSKNPVVK